MQTQLNRLTGRRAFRLGVSITTTLLLLAVLPATAQTNTPFTATGYVAGVPVPGIWATNALGQVFLKGNVHVLRVQADDALVTGRLQAGMDLAYQADGTAIFYGTAYHEVGTWQNQTNFTPAGGLWELNYRGLAQADNSNQMSMVGYGIGGAIEGLRLELTATRGPGGIFDPAVPYLVSGTNKPAPVNTRVVLDNFDDGVLGPRWDSWSSGSVKLTETNGQLNVQGSWAVPVPHTSLMDHAAARWNEDWSLAEGRTMEWRVTLAGLNDHATAATVVMGINGQRLYALYAGRDWIMLGRWGGGLTIFFDQAVNVKMTNVVLSLSLTRQQGKAMLLARILDKDNQEAVLYQKTATDLTPIFSGDISTIGVRQETDGTKPPATATFDNYERRMYEVPQVGIERAVRITWPAPTGVNWAVEGAPTVQGPWLPVQDPVLPGFQQMTVPANDIMGFFRLRQAP